MTNDYQQDDYAEPEPTLGELKEIAADTATESTERLNACIEVWRQQPDVGRDLLVAYSISLDADDEDRFNAVERLVDLGGPIKAAVSWLMWETDWGHLEGVYKGQAASIVPGYSSVKDDLAAGLSLIVTNPHLDDMYRVWAGAYRAVDWTKDSFAELRTIFDDTTIILGLEDVAKRHGQASGGVLIGDTCLAWIIDDKTLPASMRFRAADARYMLDHGEAADGFAVLATDASLSPGQRRRAIKELAEIDADRADDLRRDHPEDESK